METGIKIFGILALAILLIGIVSATPTLIRTTPTSVNPGQTFTVTYTATDTEKYFVAWSESITGGCTPTTYNDFMASETSGTKSITATFTAPSSGSCTFNGYYQFADNSQVNFPQKSVSIGGSPCVPNTACASSTCIGSTCSDGCGGTVQGTKNCGSTCTDTCSSLGYECGTQTICGASTNCGSCPSGKTCNSGKCQTTPTEPPGYCEFTEKVNGWIDIEIVSDPCTNGLYLLIGGIVLIILIIMLIK